LIAELNIGFIVTYLSHGSPGSFHRIYEICKHLSNNNKLECSILSPFSEDVNNIKDIDMCLIPSIMSKIHFSSIAYKIASRIASSRLSTNFFLTEPSTTQIVDIVRKGLYQVLKKKSLTFYTLYSLMQV
jgi:hypothetical protein